MLILLRRNFDIIKSDYLFGKFWTIPGGSTSPTTIEYLKLRRERVIPLKEISSQYPIGKHNIDAKWFEDMHELMAYVAMRMGIMTVGMIERMNRNAMRCCWLVGMANGEDFGG